MQHSDMHHQRWSLSPLCLCLAQVLSGNNGALRRNVLAYKLRAANSAVLDLYPQLQTLADSFGAPPLDTLYAFCNCCIDSYHPACHAYVPCKTLGTHVLSDCSSNACLSFSAVALCFDAAHADMHCFTTGWPTKECLQSAFPACHHLLLLLLLLSAAVAVNPRAYLAILCHSGTRVPLGSKS